MSMDAIEAQDSVSDDGTGRGAANEMNENMAGLDHLRQIGRLTYDQKLIFERTGVFFGPKRGKDDTVVVNAHDLHQNVAA
jgi:hypothetical protein